MKRLVPASQSPRRKEILERAGLPFEVRLLPVAEEHSPGESPEAYVRRLACDKAMAVPVSPDEIVLAADTTVVVAGTILEKPRDSADAARMLRLLSGAEHVVLTGVCLRDHQHHWVDCARTLVRFVPLTNAEIDAYVRSGEPHDKAGAYAIQGLASKFIDRIEGCYWNVVGLPIAMVYAQLKNEFGFAQSEEPG